MSVDQTKWKPRRFPFNKNSGTGGNNFVKWKETFGSYRPKWPNRSKWTTFKAGPEYSCLTKPKWFVPSDVSTEIPGISILGWMESAPPPPPFLARFFWNGCCSLEQSWAGQTLWGPKWRWYRLLWELIKLSHNEKHFDPFFFLILSTASLRKWLKISLEIFCVDFRA